MATSRFDEFSADELTRIWKALYDHEQHMKRANFYNAASETRKLMGEVIDAKNWVKEDPKPRNGYDDHHHN